MSYNNSTSAASSSYDYYRMYPGVSARRYLLRGEIHAPIPVSRAKVEDPEEVEEKEFLFDPKELVL